VRDPSSPGRIGRYEIRKELGRGTMGVVYEAHDPALGRTIALKTIQVPFAASAREREDYEKRFTAEARIAARLSHAGIVIVHDVGRDGDHGILYIALEHLQGRTLAEVAAEGKLVWRESLRIVGRVAEALAYAHAAGVVHRDIKPANIMLVGYTDPKIMDFGIAKLDSGQLTSTGPAFGTPLFMSPEQALSQPVDARSDLFSLGSVAYLLLAGRPPFEAENVPGILAQVAYKDPKPLREIVPELPAEIEYIVTRAMSKDPALRYGDGRKMADDIEDVLAGRPPRHRAGWTAPAIGSGTVASKQGALPELALDPDADTTARPLAVARGRRGKRLVKLIATLAGVTAVYFYLHPADRRFWGRAALEAKRSRIVDEVRAWWGRVGIDSPEAGVTPTPVEVAPAPSTMAAAPVVTTMFPAVASEEKVAASGGHEPEPGASPQENAQTPEPANNQGPAKRTEPQAPAAAPPPAPPRPSAERPRVAPPALPPAALSIQFEHHLRHGRLRVWVDETRVVDEDFDGRVTRKILSLELRKGVVQQRLALQPGKHGVRVEVRWDDNVKDARISGAFSAGASRHLDVHVSRLGGNLSLDWK